MGSTLCRDLTIDVAARSYGRQSGRYMRAVRPFEPPVAVRTPPVLMNPSWSTRHTPPYNPSPPHLLPRNTLGVIHGVQVLRREHSRGGEISFQFFPSLYFMCALTGFLQKTKPRKMFLRSDVGCQRRFVSLGNAGESPAAPVC